VARLSHGGDAKSKAAVAAVYLPVAVESEMARWRSIRHRLVRHAYVMALFAEGSAETANA